MGECLYWKDGMCVQRMPEEVCLGKCPFCSTEEQALYCDMFELPNVGKTAGMGKTAKWADVKAKGEAIASTGGVEIMRNDSDSVESYVTSSQVSGSFPVTQGGPYDVILAKKGWENSGNVGGWIAGYLCSCLWGQYHSGEPSSGWAGRFCFDPASMVLMADGTYKRIDEVEVGDMVQSRDGANRVLAVSKSEYEGPMVEMSFTGSCFPVRVTEDHPVMVNEQLDKWLSSHDRRHVGNKASLGNKLMTDVSLWNDTKRAGDFEVGDIVLFSSNNGQEPKETVSFSERYGSSVHVEDGLAYWVSGNQNDGGRWRTLNGINDVIPFDDDLAYLVGWYLAEGSTEGHDGAMEIVRWTISSKENDVAENICSILRKFGCNNPRVQDYGYRGAQAILVSSAPLAHLLSDMCGRGSRNKRLSGEVMSAPTWWQRRMVDAYYEGDGSVKGKAKSICTSSEMLAMQMSALIQRVFGVDASVHCNVNAPGPTKRAMGETKGGMVYHVDFGGSYVQRRYRVDDFHTAHRVSDVRRYEYSGTVFNLDVENEHTYVVNGLLVHNCSHAYATMLVANARARSEFMNDRTASRNMNMICRCERCGEVSNVGDDMMCETCSQQTAFEAIASVAFGCGGKREAGMVSRMNPDRVADICDDMSVCDLGGGAKMAMWRGLKAVFSSDRKTATRFFAGYEQEELQDESMGAIARNTDRRKRASW